MPVPTNLRFAVVFDLLGNRIVPGTIIVFDEYLNYPGWQEHEYRAFQEFLQTQSLDYQYIGFVPTHQQMG